MVNPVVSVVKHSILRFFSVLCVALVIAGIGWAIYRTFIKPPKLESYSQKAETIQNTEYNYDYSDKDIAFLGLKVWKIRLGVTIK